MEITEKKTDAHTEHCCRLCGCKYGWADGSPDCTVVTGKLVQSYDCGKQYTCPWEMDYEDHLHVGYEMYFKTIEDLIRCVSFWAAHYDICKDSMLVNPVSIHEQATEGKIFFLWPFRGRAFPLWPVTYPESKRVFRGPVKTDKPPDTWVLMQASQKTLPDGTGVWWCTK